VILCLGFFHTICTLLRIIGRRFADASLCDLLVEAGVVVQGSVSAVLDGRHYNHTVRAHKLVYEALLRMAWKHFEDHVDLEFDDADKIIIDDALYNLSQLSTDLCENQWQSVIQLESVQFMVNAFEKFMNFLRTSNGPLSTFWMSYMDMINLMLDTIRASREGNWDLHLAFIRSIIPWCFAYDHCNYSHYFPVSQMSNLQQQYPGIKDEFVAGSFSVQLSNYNPFGRIPVDQTIEETIKKTQKHLAVSKVSAEILEL